MAKNPTKVNETQPAEEQLPAPAPTGGEVQPATDPTTLFDLAAGAGLENVTAKDVLVPRLTIVQALSPQLKKRDPAYIEGAEIGDICDVATSEIFEQPLLVVPVMYNKVWLEWAPRSSGGGLVAIHPNDSILRECSYNDKGQPMRGPNLVAETAQVFVLNLSAGGRRSFISFASTQLKKARKWMTYATGESITRADGSSFTPPIFYRSYLLSSVEESNTQGDWSGWRIEKGKTLPELDNWRALFDRAASFRESIAKGELRADEASAAEAPAEAAM